MSDLSPGGLWTGVGQSPRCMRKAIIRMAPPRRGQSSGCLLDLLEEQTLSWGGLPRGFLANPLMGGGMFSVWSPPFSPADVTVPAVVPHKVLTGAWKAGPTGHESVKGGKEQWHSLENQLLRS